MVSLLLAGTAAAATNEAPESATNAPAPAAPGTNMVDRGHRRVSGFLLDLVDGLDRFLHNSVAGEDEEPSRLILQFYGDRYLRSRNASASYVTITPEVTFSDDPAVKMDVDFSARLRLRRLSDRLELFVDRFDDDEDLLDGVLGRVNQRLRDNDDEGGAGLRYRLPDYFSLHSSVSASVHLKPEPVPRLRLRSRLHLQMGAWQARLGETLFWESDDGVGEKTQLEFIRPLDTATVFRSSSAAVWSETSEGVDLGHAVVWSHRLSQRRLISFRAGVSGHTEPSAIVDLYSVRTTWRQRIYRDWMFLEIEPGVDFPNDEDFEAVPLLSVRFDVVLGAVKPDW